MSISLYKEQTGQYTILSLEDVHPKLKKEKQVGTRQDLYTYTGTREEVKSILEDVDRRLKAC